MEATRPFITRVCEIIGSCVTDGQMLHNCMHEKSHLTRSSAIAKEPCDALC